MELLLIRHGRPVRIDEAVDGPADPGLAPEGWRQAEALGEWLGGPAGGGIDALYASPLRRASDTARPLAGHLGVDVRVRDDLREFDRAARYYVPLEELHADDPRFTEIIDDWTGPRREAERAAFRAEVLAGIDHIVNQHESERVAVVCHGGVINAYLAQVLGLDRPLFFGPSYTSVSRVDASAGGHGTLLSINETPHLSLLAVKPT